MPNFQNPKAKALQERVASLRDDARHASSQQAREHLLNEAAKLEDEAERVEKSGT